MECAVTYCTILALIR